MLRSFIRLVVRNVPRPLMQRVASFAIPLMGLMYMGRGKECPICGVKRRKFLPYGYNAVRDNALCPNCLSLERHRLMWLYLKRETTIFGQFPKLLHIAPEVAIMKRLSRAYRKAGKATYVTADLESPLAQLHFDVQQIPLPDDSYDMIICNHLLEHVDDDRQAMSELLRILRPGGWAMLLSPVDLSRAETYEDKSIVSPEERDKHFGQYDHLRLYGRDYAERLQEAGFVVEQNEYFSQFTDEQKQLYALRDEILYIARKP